MQSLIRLIASVAAVCGVCVTALAADGAPIGAWFKAELKALVRDVLSTDVVKRRGLLDPEAVQRTVREHELQQEDRTDHLLALINLELWCRLYLDGTSTGDLTDELRGSLAA